MNVMSPSPHNQLGPEPQTSILRHPFYHSKNKAQTQKQNKTKNTKYRFWLELSEPRVLNTAGLSWITYLSPQMESYLLAQKHFSTDFYDIISLGIFLQGTQNSPLQPHSGLITTTQNSAEYSNFGYLLNSYLSRLLSKMDLQVNMMTSPLYRWE